MNERTCSPVFLPERILNNTKRSAGVNESLEMLSKREQENSIAFILILLCLQLFTIPLNTIVYLLLKVYKIIHNFIHKVIHIISRNGSVSRF